MKATPGTCAALLYNRIPDLHERAGPALTVKPEPAVALAVPVLEIDGVPHTRPLLAVQKVVIPATLPSTRKGMSMTLPLSLIGIHGPPKVVHCPFPLEA